MTFYSILAAFAMIGLLWLMVKLVNIKSKSWYVDLFILVTLIGMLLIQATLFYLVLTPISPSTIQQICSDYENNKIQQQIITVEESNTIVKRDTIYYYKNN